MRRNIIIAIGIAVVLLAGGFFLTNAFAVQYRVGSDEEQRKVSEKETDENNTTPSRVLATHIKTPDPLKAIYMTSWVSGTPSLRENIIKLIDDTEINSVVIDIKDDTGRISYEVSDPDLHKIFSWENRIPDARELIARLHDKDIYVIGRISVFQDPFYTKLHPELAVKRASDGGVWKDYKGLSFIDVGAEEYWKYIIAIARDAHEAGFDEINFDYIRFPSDGNMKDIAFPYGGTRPKSDVLEDFFAYLYEELGGSGAVLSADLFGYTTTNTDDLGIGQLIERALPYFNYVMPMVYPSHYNDGFIGYANPAAHPYEVVKYSMDAAVRRAKKMQLAKDSTATSTEIATLREQTLKGHGNVSPSQLRPWLQDFDLGATYTPEMVRAQMQATYDSGLSSWSLWDAGNTYTRSALMLE